VREPGARQPPRRRGERGGGEGRRAAALQAALQLDPQVHEAQIVPIELDLMFVYTRRDGNTLHVQRVQADGKFGHMVPIP
jgi:hypothetical protein